MELDLVRDILIAVDSDKKFRTSSEFITDINPDADDVEYIKELYEKNADLIYRAGFIFGCIRSVTVKNFASKEYICRGLSGKGEDFLRIIKNPEVFAEIKRKIGRWEPIVSFKIVKKIGTKIIEGKVGL